MLLYFDLSRPNPQTRVILTSMTQKFRSKIISWSKTRILASECLYIVLSLRSIMFKTEKFKKVARIKIRDM